MINLTLTVDNIGDVLKVFNVVEFMRYTGSGVPTVPVDLVDYTSIDNGIDQINNRTDVTDVHLDVNYTQYYFTDPNGDANSWYISRYTTLAYNSFSGWSDPIQGDSGDLYFNPVYPPEVSYGTQDKMVLDKIRVWIGDPVGLNREFGPEAASSIHPDNRVYQLDEKGWPASINMYGKQYNDVSNPTVNGYKFLRFTEAIDATITTISGVEQSVDIWYYTFRNSDRQIMEVYDTTFSPAGLTSDQCTSEIYMLQAAYDLLTQETWEVINEDGAKITDEGSSYDPAEGIKARDKMLSKLRKRLDDAIRFARGPYRGGVRID